MSHNGTAANLAPRMTDWLILVLAPVFFSTNLIFGRGIGQSVDPFILAFIRWSATFLLLLPFVWKEKQAALQFIQNRTRLWLFMGFLGMWVCGALVYWSLHFTTASNATLIYTTSSLFILIIERVLRGRRIGARELAGMIIAFFGVAVIVLRGDLSALANLQFNPGDLGILAASVSWALYSALQKDANASDLSNLATFGIMTAAGSLTLLPFATFQLFAGAPLPSSNADWMRIGGIVLFSSLLAFSCFQHAVRVFGAPFAGIFFYLAPPLSIVLAVTFLGEHFQRYHMFGILFVMGGIILATIQTKAFAKKQ